MKKQIFTIFTFLFLSLVLSAQNNTKAQIINKPLPEGRYWVTMTFGGNPEGSSTTVKAESRRLMLENIVTLPGQKIKKSFVVDVRTPQINDSVRIKIKTRENSGFCF